MIKEFLSSYLEGDAVAKSEVRVGSDETFARLRLTLSRANDRLHFAFGGVLELNSRSPLDEGLYQWLQNPIIVHVVHDSTFEGHKRLNSPRIAANHGILHQGVDITLVGEGVGQKAVCVPSCSEEAIRTDGDGGEVALPERQVIALHDRVKGQVGLDAEEGRRDHSRQAEEDERCPEAAQCPTFGFDGSPGPANGRR